MSLAVDLMVITLFAVAITYCIYRLIWVDVVEEKEGPEKPLWDEVVFCCPDWEGGPVPEDTPRCYVCGVSAYEPPDYEVFRVGRRWWCREHMPFEDD